MKLQLVKGETSVILTVFILDSSSAVGAGLAGLDQTSSIVGGYLKRNGTGVALAVDENVTTEGTYEAPSAAGKVRIGTPANMTAGTYELHFHNDLFTTADWVTITLGGAANMAPLLIEVQLTSVNPNDAVRMGMTALPNATPDSVGGLPTEDANGRVSADATAVSGDATAADNLELIIENAKGADHKILISTDAQDLKATLTVGSYLKGILTTALTETGGYLAAGFKKFFNVETPVATAETVNQTGDAYAVVAHADHGNAKLVRSTTPANTLDVAATGEAGLDFNNINAATGATTLTNITVPIVTTVGTTTTNTDMRGTDGAYTGTPPTVGEIRTEMEGGGTKLTAVHAVIPATAPPTNTQFEARSLATADYGTAANQTTLLNRIGAFTGTGLNTILGFLKALMSKAGGLTPSDVGGTYDNTTDSVEAIRDTAPLGTAMRGTDSAALASVCTEERLARLDAAVTTRSSHSAANVRTEMDSNSTKLANLDATISSRATPGAF